jgi:hypothetical protein
MEKTPVVGTAAESASPHAPVSVVLSDACVAQGLTECGDNAEPADVRRPVDRCLLGTETAVLGTKPQANDVTAATAAVSVASMPHGGSPRPQPTGSPDGREEESPASIPWPDGPGESGFFWWRGHPYHLSPLRFRMLSVLWSASEHTLSMEDVLLRVWGIGPARITTRHVGTLRVTASRTVEALAGTGIEIHVRRDRISGRVRVSLVTPPSNR